MVRGEIAVDATSVTNATGLSVVTFSHTTGAGPSRALLVGVSMQRGGGDRVNNITYGGQALTFVGAKMFGGHQIRVEIWRLINPPTGSANVVVTFNGSSDGFVVGATTFTGVHQTAPVGAFSFDTGTTAVPSVVANSATNDVAFGLVAFRSGVVLNPGLNQIELWSGADSSNVVRGVSGIKFATPSATLSWSQPASSSQDWAAGAVPIKPAIAADLQVTSAGPSTAIAGANLTYTISVTNLGPSISTNVVVTNNLPSGTTFVSASDGGVFSSGAVLWTLGTLSPNTGTNFTVTCTVPQTPGSLTNSVSASADTLDTTPANNNGTDINSRVVTAVTAGPFAKLQLLMPGEVAAPGTATGKTGSPATQTVGIPFAVTVQAVDAFWNLVNASDVVRLTSGDGDAVLPADTALSAGATSMNITFLTAGNITATASDITNPAITADTSPAVVVNKGNQTISFPSIPDQMRTNTVSLLATASSGLPVSFAVASGPAEISNGTNLTFTAAGTVTITASQSGNANWNGATDVSHSFNVNSLPIPSSPTLQRWPLAGVKIRMADLLGVDPDGDIISLVSAGPGSVQGASISTNSVWVFYTPASGNTNADSFQYVVSDTRGGTNQGTVTVILSTNTNPSANYIVIDLGDGSAQVHFAGIPGRAYSIEFTDEAVPSTWLPLTTSAADATGQFQCLDTIPAAPATRSYRATEISP